MTTRTILSIDDDPDILALMGVFLKKEGYQALTANSAHKALKILEKEDPDLILLDVNMPELDGYTFCSRLQEHPRWALIPVIFVTAFKREADRLQAFKTGGVDFLSKPLSQQMLAETLKRHLDTRDIWLQEFKSRQRGSAQQPTTPPTPSEPVIEAPPPPKTITEPPPTSMIDPALSLPTTTGEKSLAEISELGRFKEYLFSQFKLPQNKWQEFLQAPAADLYVSAYAMGISEQDVARHLSVFTQCAYREGINPEEVSLGIFPIAFCKRHMVVPLVAANLDKCFVVSNPFDIELMDAVQRHRGYKLLITEPTTVLSVFGAAPTAALKQKHAAEKARTTLNLDQIMEKLQPKLEPEVNPLDSLDLDDALPLKEDAPLVMLVNKLIEDAYRMGASDIHIEPQEHEVTVRYRIDGELQIITQLRPAKLIQPLATRIKIMCDLNIAEKRMPQDGRIVFKRFTRSNLDFDLRVATAPMNFGEKIVMRILDKQKNTLPLEKMGFAPWNLSRYRAHIRTPYGMVLHVGPTGSGKSMTLYSALNELSGPGINIQTAEDPIEYTLPHINQMQVQPEIGLTFARALRAYLRQDPDVILVGEIRDQETAEIAVEAALTGHLLLSTLHTNDAAATVTRFIEMGIEPFMISASLIMVCAQRLIRLLCPVCKEAYIPSDDEKIKLGYTPTDERVRLYRAKGCEACNHIGYKGRTGVHELLVPDDAMRRAMTRPGINTEEIKQMAVSAGMSTLYWDGVYKVRQGLTSFEEILAKIRPDEFDSRPDWVLNPIALEAHR